MAVSNIKDLWELAATMMGGSFPSQIVDTNSDMSSPTTPLELTFDQVYNNTRRRLLESADWLFARRYEELVSAPVKNYAGVTQDWDPGGRWAAAYREPDDSIKFLGFAKDYNDLNLVGRFQKKALPIQYVDLVSTGELSGIYTFGSLPFGGYLYEDGITIDFVDESYVRHKIFAFRVTGTYPNSYRMKTDNGVVDGIGTFQDFNDSLGTATVSLAFIAGADGDVDFDTADYPATLTMRGAIEPTDEYWTEHILTDQPDPIGVYIIDHNVPVNWPPQFQDYVAAEMALTAAGVHAKSSKHIQFLRDNVIEKKNEAINNLSSESGNLTPADGLSSTAAARL